MRKTLVRAVALLLTTVISVGIIPSVEILANPQYPVTVLKISNLPVTTGYRFNLYWEQPPSDYPFDRDNNDSSATDYHIYTRNATRGHSFTTIPVYSVKDNAPGSPTFNHAISPTMDPGSLYAIRVEPVHMHVVRDNNGNILNTSKAPMVTGVREAQALYLTDLRVEAGGSGNSMTVTWDYPKFDGKDIFDGYSIYYAEGGALNRVVPDSPRVDVPVQNTTVQDGTRLQYTFQDDNLKAGVPYAVKVEPYVLINGVPVLVRTLESITYSGVTYSIAYTDRTSNEYRTNDAMIKISLNVIKEDDTSVRVIWDSFATVQNVTKVEIYSSTDKAILESITPTGSPPLHPSGTYLGTNASNLNYWITASPDRVTYYMIIRYIADGNNEIKNLSEIAMYDPFDTDFEPYSPKITKTEASETKPTTIQIEWDGFIRLPYTPDERNDLDEYGMYLDREMYYEIWLTDNSNYLDDMTSEDVIVPSLYARSIEVDRTTTPPTYKLPSAIREYYTAVIDPVSNAITGYERRALEDNKVYFIKIRARRTSGQLSRPAYSSIFVPPVGSLPTDPFAISKPPLRIKLDEEGNEVVTGNSITIQWDTRWVEAYNDADKSWYSLVGVDSSGNMLYGDDATKNAEKVVLLNNPNYQSGDATGGYKPNAEAISSALGTQITEDNLRLLDLRDAMYEIYVSEYDLMTEGYERFLANLQNESNQSSWVSITPEGDPEHPEFMITSCDNPSGALKDNKSYIIFFRPYVMIDQKRVAYVPNFVVGTTRDTRQPVDIKPTVPVLEPVLETDTTLTVRWEYSTELTYDLAYSENLADYKDRGNRVPWATISSNRRIVSETDPNTGEVKQYIVYRIEGLFPETVHHIWIRAMSLTESSEWSNPISMTTKDIEAPAPPRALGLAAKEHVDLYNKSNSTKFTAAAADYLIVEWMRDPSDEETTLSSIGGNTESAELMPHPDIQNIIMTRFKNLTANRAYYLRAKTVLTVTKAGDGTIKRQYNYIVQISPDEDFRDMVEISVPLLDDIEVLDPVYTKRKESSAWSITIPLFTRTSGDEYDGDKNPAQYPLPEQDYEIIYDKATDTLTFRFRTDKQDATSANDNNVDQRFVSRLIANKTYIYTVDLSTYNNKTVTNRAIELPYSVFDAFEERKIQFSLKAGNATVNIPPGSLKTSEVNSLTDFGKGANVKILVNSNARNTPELDETDAYLSTPQRLTIQVVTPSRTLTLNNTAKQIKIEMKLDNRHTTVDQNVAAYISDSNTAGWERISSSYDGLAGQVSFNTYKPANYSAIAKPVATMSMNSDSLVGAGTETTYNSLLNITSRMNITDLGSFSPQDPVSANLFNNLVAGVAYNRSSFSVNKSLPNEDYIALGKSNLLVPGVVVSREAGISSLVRLYEMKTKKNIKIYPDLASTPFTDISKADGKYTNNLLKAVEIGFLDNSLQIDARTNTPIANPKGNLNMGDLFYMVDIIMQDSGY